MCLTTQTHIVNWNFKHRNTSNASLVLKSIRFAVQLHVDLYNVIEVDGGNLLEHRASDRNIPALDSILELANGHASFCPWKRHFTHGFHWFIARTHELRLAVLNKVCVILIKSLLCWAKLVFRIVRGDVWHCGRRESHVQEPAKSADHKPRCDWCEIFRRYYSWLCPRRTRRGYSGSKTCGKLRYWRLKSFLLVLTWNSGIPHRRNPAGLENPLEIKSGHFHTT